MMDEFRLKPLLAKYQMLIAMCFDVGAEKLDSKLHNYAPRETAVTI
jgi:hypothetical protein